MDLFDIGRGVYGHGGWTPAAFIFVIGGDVTRIFLHESERNEKLSY
jgi:hypothetical protein